MPGSRDGLDHSRNRLHPVSVVGIGNTAGNQFSGNRKESAMKDKPARGPENANVSDIVHGPDGDRGLTCLREHIDRQDKELIRILANRHDLIREAAQCKIKDGKDLWDEKRVEEIIQTRSQWARQHNLDPELVADIFRRLIEGNMQIERKILQKCRDK